LAPIVLGCVPAEPVAGAGELRRRLERLRVLGQFRRPDLGGAFGAPRCAAISVERIRRLPQRFRWRDRNKHADIE